MMRTAFISLLTVCLVVLYMAPDHTAHASNRVIAVVDGSPISLRDLERRSSLLALTLGKPPSEAKNYRDFALQELISEMVIVNKADEFGVKLNADSDKTVLDNFLTENNLSRSQFSTILSRYDLDESEIINKLQSSLYVRNLVQARVLRDVTISDLELDLELSLYRQSVGEPLRRLSLIQLPITAENNLLRLTQVAKNIMEDLKRGVGFVNIARQISRHPSAKNGGDLGWIHPARVPTPIRDIVDQMEVGTISPATVVDDSVYIVAYVEKKLLTERDIPNRESLRRDLLNRKIDLLARKKLSDWEAEAYVEIRDLKAALP